MERYFTIVQQKEEECQKNYWAAIFTWCLLASTVVFDYMLGANQKHDEMLYTWFETISPPAMVAILFTMTFITGGIYVGTYLVSKRKIRASLANKRSSKFDVDVIRVKLERKILFSCIAMGGSIFVCYMPISIVMLGALYEPAGDFTAALVFGNLMVALDVLISPALVLVFMPALRKTLFGVFKRQTAASQEGDGRV
ncbi:hypothetical protein BDR26DRAFT_621200 [Obelidium mucronatum]|nr:hypothetical protein BDR26DRAFT_621200 [Obelidium mucronatum]